MRPLHLVLVHQVQQFQNVVFGEAARIARRVDVAGRGADQRQLLEEFRAKGRRHHADRGAHRVSDEHDRALTERLADLDQILGIAVQGRMPRSVVGRQVGCARPHMIEQHDLAPFGQRPGHVAPHALVAPDPVGEQDGRAAFADDRDVVA